MPWSQTISTGPFLLPTTRIKCARYEPTGVMDWKKKTVSMGLVDTKTFDTLLATVTVSENRVAVDPHDVEDWGHIIEELGAHTILEEAYWDEVVDVSVTIEDLYYPHINIKVQSPQNERSPRHGLDTEKRIYFREDEQEELDACFKAIRAYWNKWRQNQTRPENMPETEDDVEEQEEVELEDALREQARSPDDQPPAAAPEPETASAAQHSDEPQEQPVDAVQAEEEDAPDTDTSGDEDAEEQEKDEKEKKEDVEEVVERFMQD